VQKSKGVRSYRQKGPKSVEYMGMECHRGAHCGREFVGVNAVKGVLERKEHGESDSLLGDRNIV